MESKGNVVQRSINHETILPRRLENENCTGRLYGYPDGAVMRRMAKDKNEKPKGRNEMHNRSEENDVREVFVCRITLIITPENAD
jgi:hypothetical protein